MALGRLFAKPRPSRNAKLRKTQDATRCAQIERLLPITSAHVESTIKHMNRRVKGTEKFWSESGSEAILQLRADALSETQPPDEFWTRRAGQVTGERRQTERNPEKTLSA